MIYKRIKNKLIIFIILLVTGILATNVSYGAVTISTNSVSMSKGETKTITITGSNGVADVNVTSSNPNVATASISGEAWVENSSISLNIKGIGEGNATITVSGEFADNANPGNQKPYTLSIQVKVGSQASNTNNNTNTNNSTNTNNNATPQKSNNAKLSNLGFTPNDFKGFTPSKTSYSATVPNSVSSVNIYANKGQNGQTITGTGKKDLQEGVNQFSVVVTAEDGTTKNTYNLSITREAAKEDEDKTEENEDTTNTEETETEEEIKVGLEKLTIDGITLSPSFKKDVYEYTAKLIGDKTKLDISTTAIDEGQIIEVIGNEDLKEGENVITITVQSDDEKETATYQITVNKSLVDEEAIAREKAEAEKQEKEKQQRIIIIAVIVVAIIVVGIILLVRYIKYRNSDEEYFDEDEEDESYYEEMQKPKSLNNIRETADDIINNLGKEEEPEPEETEKEEYKEENYDYQDFEEIERKARKKKSKGKRFKED